MTPSASAILCAVVLGLSGAPFSWFIGVVLGFALYTVLMRRQIAATA